MKNNKMMRLAAIVLMLTLLTTCAISGTFAKYVSTASGEDTARVAKWDFKVNNTTANTSNTFTFDLFATVCDTNTTSDDTDVKDTGADGKTLIAPGTWGYADIVLNNTSEVSAKYAIAFGNTNTDIPLEFVVVSDASGEAECPATGWKTDLTDFDIAASADTTITVDGSAETVRVYWRWAIGASDDVNDTTNKNDTTLGLAGTAEVTLSATVTVTQVD